MAVLETKEYPRERHCRHSEEIGGTGKEVEWEIEWIEAKTTQRAVCPDWS